MSASEPKTLVDGLRNGGHELAIRVYYEDTDFSGVVYHANYLKFFERGRTELLRMMGFHQSAMHARDDAAIAFAVRRLTIDFFKPALMDDVVVVRTLPALVRPASFELVQTLSRNSDVLTECSVSIVAVASGRARRIPKDVSDAMLALCADASNVDASERSRPRSPR